MGCCLVLLAVGIGPRLVLFLLWFFTDWTWQAFQTRIWPFLGFVFLPFATLFYLIAMRYHQYQFTSAVIFWTIVGLIFDAFLTGWLKKQTW